MTIIRLEAIDLLNKWFTERTLLRCDVTVERFAASLRGRIVSVSEREFRLLSEDTFSEFALGLSPDLEFNFTDGRNFPPETPAFEQSLVFIFPERSGIEPEFIALNEFSATSNSPYPT